MRKALHFMRKMTAAFKSICDSNEQNERKENEARRIRRINIGAEYGRVVGLLETFLHKLRWLSPLYWITRICPKLDRSRGVPEIYVFVALVIELVFFCLLCWYPHPSSNLAFVVWAILLFILRLVDIIQRWFMDHIFTRNVISPVRSLVLALINFVEVCFIFAIGDFIARNSFKPTIQGVEESLYHSVRIITAMGSDLEPSSCIGYLLFYGEVFCGIVFLIAVIGLIIAYFRR